ncbi:uncharacterized protein LOC104898295 [Beta vulgaris subsp. vulgaris]|uniref:uncharacterized protein LOC104898295 n=1 Tax=Beta vulgaris subsp. vulgaris TaxID=3555 RepID=UPI000540074E|nr:uncharacterized protein LOC104898295 [Beta vulgaris subsp. vulgaris]
MKVPSGMSWVLKKIMKSRELFDNGSKIHEYETDGRFSINKCYKAIREPNIQVSWKRLVCNNRATPKSIFITWLAVLNRLSTKTIFAQWSLVSDTTCELCNNGEEDIHHLFFQCEYSGEIWRKCLSILKKPRNPVSFMEEVLIAANHCRRRHKKNKLYGMMFTEAIYNIWMQHNQKIFEGQHKTTDHIVNVIVFNVAARVEDNMRNLLFR